MAHASFWIHLLICGVVGSACSPSSIPTSQPRARGAPDPSPSLETPPAQQFVFSPQPEAHPTGEPKVCGQHDAGLQRAAQGVLEDYARTGVLPDADTLTARVRSEGLPYVWVRAWAAVAPDSRSSMRALEKWSQGFSAVGIRRCGVASLAGQGSLHAVALLADVLADVSPVGRHGHVGQWLPIAAQLHVEVSDVQLLALPPRGLPYSLPVHVTPSGLVQARVALASPGRWLFQVLPETAAGPRPAAEIEVFVDVSASEYTSDTGAVPGERDARCNNERCDAEALTVMANAARESERLALLVVHTELERLATAHARAMAERRQLAHDLGKGDAYLRVTTELPSATLIGENVAHANTARDAHRALWRSPAHRLNLLRREYTHIGVGVAHGTNGDVWTCQLFAAESSGP